MPHVGPMWRSGRSQGRTCSKLNPTNNSDKANSEASTSLERFGRSPFAIAPFIR
jgi:hypothetical protein